MTDVVSWFVSHILPYLFIAFLGGAWTIYRKVEKLQHDLATLARDTHQLATVIDNKWKEVDGRVKEDIDELKRQIEYISRNHVSREELNQYLAQLNSTVIRIQEALNKL